MRFGRQRGQAMVIVALLMTAMVGFLGLSIDGGRLYIERRALQNGSDAASLAMSDAYFGAKNSGASVATSLTTAFSAGLTEFAAQAQQTTVGWATTGSPPSDCSVTPVSGTNYPPSSAPGGGNVVQYVKNGYTLLLSAWKSSSTSESGICVFNASATHSIPTFFINVLSALTSVSATSVASSVSAHIFTPPTLLVLDPSCGPPGAQDALTIAGGAHMTVYGASRTDGDATASGSYVVNSNGNFFDHCDSQATVNGFNFNYNAGSGGFGGASRETDPLLGFAGSFASTYFVSPYSTTSPTDTESSTAACNNKDMHCVVVEPGTYTNTANFPSSGGCWFVEPGIYSWANTGSHALDFNAQGVVISNELTAPDGTNPKMLSPSATGGATTNSESPLFHWDLPTGGGSQRCLGEIKTYTTSTPLLGAKANKYYFRVSSVREERFTPPGAGSPRNFWRESYLTNTNCPPGTSMATFPGCTVNAGTNAAAGCWPVQADGNQTYEIGISNVPGMGNPSLGDGHDTLQASEYHIYASTTGCSGPFGYVTKADTSIGTFRQTIDSLAATSKIKGCPYLPDPIAITGAGPVPNNSTDVDLLASPTVQCSLGYNGSNLINTTNLGAAWSVTGVACDPSVPAAGCQAPYITAPVSVGTGTAAAPDFAPDAANEDECIDASGARCNPNPLPTTSEVTPGGAMFYFPNTTNCINQTQGAPYIFGALQWNSVVMYNQALAGQNQSDPNTPVDCGNNAQINGSAGGQFIGIVYSPDALITVQGSGSPIDGGVVVWRFTVGAGSDTTLTGRFPRVQEITPGHLIDCTNGGVVITTYCASP